MKTAGNFLKIKRGVSDSSLVATASSCICFNTLACVLISPQAELSFNSLLVRTEAQAIKSNSNATGLYSRNDASSIIERNFEPEIG
jgi:hypothetical protein